MMSSKERTPQFEEASMSLEKRVCEPVNQLSALNDQSHELTYMYQQDLGSTKNQLKITENPSRKRSPRLTEVFN